MLAAQHEKAKRKRNEKKNEQSRRYKGPRDIRGRRSVISILFLRAWRSITRERHIFDPYLAVRRS